MTTTDDALFALTPTDEDAPARGSRHEPEPAVGEQAAGAVHPGQWRLARVEVVNWGTFQGRHAVDVAREGFLITGESGSGKSSLIDAISAVLVPGGKVRFNAAAQDAGSARGDRTVHSYVRGAWRRNADEDTGEVSADFLRRGATWSGIALTYRDGTGAPPVVLMRYVHVKRGQAALGPGSTVFLVLRGEHVLRDFEQFVRDGIEQRRLKAALPGPEALVTDKHSSFLARYVQLLGVPGEQAVHLLHKTQSAKNLSSLDGLLREFMLDEPDTFALATKAVADFRELRGAHDAVVTARHQIEALSALQDPAARFESAVARHEHLDRVLAVLPGFVARTTRELAAAELAGQQEQLRHLEHRLAGARRALADGEDAVRAAERERDDAGGRDVRELEKVIELRRHELRTVRERRCALNDELARVGLPPVESEQDLLALQERAGRETAGDDAQAVARRAVEEAVSANTRARDAVRDLERELTAARSTRSNLGEKFLDRRRRLAEELGLEPSDLPFGGELLQVRPEHSAWTGAIERVLHPLATTLLVRQEHYPDLARLVDEQHLGLRLVYQRVPDRVPVPPGTSSERSVVDRVEIAPGTPFAPWLAHHLAERYDYECVDTVTQFRRAGDHDRMVTRAGQVRHRHGRHEKDDRFRVDDRSRWVLGFDNEAKRERLEQDLAEARREATARQGELAGAYQRAEHLTLRRSILARVAPVQWPELDEAGAERLLDADQEHRDVLVHGNAGLTLAVQRVAERSAERERLRAAEREADLAVGTARSRADQLRSVLEQAAPSSPPFPEPPAVLEDLAARFADPALGVDTVERFHRRVQGAVSSELAEQAEAMNKARSVFERRAGDVRRQWPALVAELTPVVEDRAAYAAVLARLEQDDLPRHAERFAELWRSQSQRNIGVLAAAVRGAARAVRQRIDPVNESLARSPFDVDRVLRIEVRDARTREVTDFLNDLREVTQGVIGLADEETAEQQFTVLSRVVDRLGSEDAADRRWRAHVLDTRLHVTFVGQELEPDGTVVNVHDSSTGLSGGQRQKLVVFCMAAALRYQLTEEDEAVPRYGTVVLDEAFDKADHRFTRMAMDVFQEFGFQMVLATPLKLLQVLERYIGGVAYVSCEAHQRSHLSHVPVTVESPGSSA